MGKCWANIVRQQQHKPLQSAASQDGEQNRAFVVA